MEENTNTSADTPEGAPHNNEQAQNPGSGSGFSFDEVIYGENKGEGAAPSEGQPAQPTPAEGQKLPDGNIYQAKNDDKRFEYWQSRAAKLENDIKRMEPVIRNAEIQAQQPQQQAQQQQEEQFPDPPEKPKRPVGYSREAAYTDPNSPSAQFENEVEEWRDKMDEYNNLRVQYSEAVMAEQYNAVEEARRQDYVRSQKAQKEAQDRHKVSEYVQANYGLSPEETSEFIDKFSNPQSITIDNLVGLYNLQRGKGGGAPINQAQAPPVGPTPNPGTPQGPSDAFRQTQRAQQIPQPMGVMASGQNPNANEAPGTRGKGFMNDLIDYNNKKNPF
tara:strand:+ start:28671 stop:29663 length:993 start_codon:yes stop_codon:yes gene_type:complete